MRYLLILIIFICGCGFHGEATRLDDNTITWSANRPCIIKDNKQQFELDGKGTPLIELPDVPLTKVD